MHPRLSAMLAATFFAACVLGHAQDDIAATQPPTLHVGDPAPALAPGTWIKGEPVTAFATGNVYVIEFWATWCGPCRKSIPHLTDLQARFKDRGVVVIGQNCSETNAAAVREFVDKMGDQMNYRVALDDTRTDPSGRMNSSWMEAAGQQGIPTAFLIDAQGRIAWIGHPMNGLDAVLEGVLAGTFDAAREAEQGLARQKAQDALYAALNAGDMDKALALADALVAVQPGVATQVAMLKFKILLEKKDYAQAYAIGDQVLEAMQDDADGLNQIAWVMATSDGVAPRGLELAEKAAVRARDVSKGDDAAILDTLARVYFEQGKLDQAVATQTEALARATDQDKALIQESLTKYTATRDAKSPSKSPAATP